MSGHFGYKSLYLFQLSLFYIWGACWVGNPRFTLPPADDQAAASSGSRRQRQTKPRARGLGLSIHTAPKPNKVPLRQKALRPGRWSQTVRPRAGDVASFQSLVGPDYQLDQEKPASAKTSQGPPEQALRLQARGGEGQVSTHQNAPSPTQESSLNACTELPASYWTAQGKGCVGRTARRSSSLGGLARPTPEARSASQLLPVHSEQPLI